MAKAVASQGTLLKIGTGTIEKFEEDTFIDFSISSLSRSGSTVQQIDVTTFSSDGNEYISGTTDYGTITASYNYAPGEDAQKLLQTHEDTKRKFNCKIIYPDDGLGNGEVVVNFKATIENMNENANTNDAIRGSITLKISGKPTIKLPTKK